MGKVISLFRRPLRAPTRDELVRATTGEVRDVSERLRGLALQLAQFDARGRRRRRRVRDAHGSRDPEVRAVYQLAEHAEGVAAELAGEPDDIPF